MTSHHDPSSQQSPEDLTPTEQFLQKYGDRLTFAGASFGLAILSFLAIVQSVASMTAAQHTVQSIRSVVEAAQTADKLGLSPEDWNSADEVPTSVQATLSEWPVAEISKQQLCQYAEGPDRFWVEEYRLCIGMNPRFSGTEFQAGDRLTPEAIGFAANLPNALDLAPEYQEPQEPAL